MSSNLTFKLKLLILRLIVIITIGKLVKELAVHALMLKRRQDHLISLTFMIIYAKYYNHEVIRLFWPSSSSQSQMLLCLEK